jgi:hypothetical protein
MPIKLPKGFQRRKSSGNALEEVQNPPGQSTFRVFERPGTGGKSFDAGQNLRSSTESKPLPPTKRSLEEDDDLFSVQKAETANRYGLRSISSPALANKSSGSGGTDNSASTAPYDSASISTRMSYASTNPSSTSIRSVQKSTNSTERPYDDIPVPPTPKQRPGFLRGASRGFSFGNKSQHDSNNTPAPPVPPPHTNYNEQPLPDLPDHGRDRSVTESSASTATPPKLFNSDLALDSSELDSFSNMFDNIGRRSIVPSPGNSSVVRGVLHLILLSYADITQNLLSSPPQHGHGTSRQQRSAIPPPLNIDRDRTVESSPYSWTSNDNLLGSPSPTKTVVPHGTSPQLMSRKPLNSRGLQENNTPDMRRPNDAPVRKSPSPLGHKLNTALSPPERSYSSQHLLPDQSPAQEFPTSPDSRNSFDSNLAAEADLVSKWQQKPAAPAAPKSNNKIMTPAQFERYRQQQEREQRLAGPSGDNHGDSDSDHYEDEDDAERDRQAVRQRRKQEAHLAVYRQTMMKVTGEQANPRSASGLSGRVPNSSSTDLNARMSYLTVDSKISGKSSNDEEEDDDVPLGILAAHGFPNKNRPPTRLASASSPSIATMAHPQAPTAAGSNADGKRGSLPVFARNLPQDPYFGAGVVNPSHRESMGMGGGSVLGVPPTPNLQPYPVHPGGLVGVIANEEKSRQMRRGSPNAQGGYEMPPQPGMLRSQSYPEMMGMPPMLTPGEMQMNQQMAQMMQMQQQFMQQMQQMMGGQPGPPMPMIHPTGSQSQGSLLMPPSQVQRPHSMPMPPSPGPPGPRSMSTLNPGMANWSQRPNSYLPPMNGIGGQGYAASLAPSERSNVGLAQRYRPVSTVGQENPSWKRSSTFTSGTIRPVITNRGTPSTIAVDDDDDDEGWKDLKAKRDNKKSKWKLKKAQTGLADLFPNGGAL